MFMPNHFPLGLGGLYAGMATLDIEDRVTQVQESVKSEAESHSELWRQAMYQYLYGCGHRIPTDMHRALRTLAKKEREV
jgi:hypothetical protein